MKSKQTNKKESIFFKLWENYCNICVIVISLIYVTKINEIYTDVWVKLFHVIFATLVALKFTKELKFGWEDENEKI